MPITNTPPPARKTQAKTPAVPVVTATKQREDAINGLGQIAQALLITTKQYADAGALGAYFPDVSKEIAKLADTDERIAKLVDPLLQAGPYAGLIAAVLPLVMQLMVNHKIAQPGAMGTVPASLLEAQIKTRMAQMELEVRQQQEAAEKALRAMTDAMGDHVRESTGGK